MRRLTKSAGALLVACMACGCTSLPWSRDRGLPPCTPSSLSTDVCDTARLPSGIEYPKPQEERRPPA